MKESRWSELKEVFQRALEGPVEERERVLEEAGGDPELRAELEALLRAHEEAGPVTGSGVDVPARALEGAAGPPVHIQGYGLGEVLGEGGFGVVYRAEQLAPVRRPVALKLIKPGMDSAQVIARFEAERQTLAQLDHPGIARIFDAGMTRAGRPYFAMELVEGAPITEYCDRAALPMDDRLRLFESVCQAVDHAHLRGIIHRDLKPSNVLVRERETGPEAKVIDFGVAKAVDPTPAGPGLTTSVRQIIGTPEYMAPEQAGLANGSVDTRADVYSLGVLLYELLTGSRLLELESSSESSYDDLKRHIREHEPERPSDRVSQMGERITEIAARRRTAPRELRRRLRGDLDWVVMKAVEKDRERRYPSAREFGAEVRRVLEHVPVLAGPPGLAYRARKLVRRYSVAFVAGSLATVAVLAGAIAAAWGYVVASDQRDAAEAAAADARTEATKARTVVRFVEELLRASDWHDVRPPDFKASDLLREFAEGLGERLASEPEVECVVRTMVADAFLSLGEPVAAEVHLERAEALVGGLRDPSLDLHAACLLTRAQLHHVRREYAEFEAAARRCLDLLSGTGEESLRSAKATAMLADAALHLHRPADAESASLAARDALERLGATETPLAVEVAVQFARAASEQNDFGDAIARHRAALALARRVYGGDHPNLADRYSELAASLWYSGDPGEAVELYRKALAVRRRFHDGDHLAVAQGLQQLGQGLWALASRAGDAALLDEAEAALREAMEMRARLVGVDDEERGLILSELAHVHANRSDFDEAVELSRQAVAAFQRSHGDDHPYVAIELGNLAFALGNLGRNDEAVEVAREASAIGRQVFRAPDKELATILQHLAVNLDAVMQLDEAEALAREVLAMRRALDTEPNPRTAGTAMVLGQILWAQRRWADAEPYLREATASARRSLGPRHPTTASYVTNLALAHMDFDDFLGAAEVLRQSGRSAAVATVLRAELCRRSDDPAERPWSFGEARLLLGEALLDSGSRDEALTHLTTGFAAAARHQGQSRGVGHADLLRRAAYALARLHADAGRLSESARWARLGTSVGAGR